MRNRRSSSERSEVTERFKLRPRTQSTDFKNNRVVTKGNLKVTILMKKDLNQNK